MINIRCEIHGDQVNQNGAVACPICGRKDMGRNWIAPKSEKRFCTPMMFTLSFEDRVLLQVDAWYLILSAILRAEPPFALSKALEESMLTAKIEIGGEEYVFEVPQPPEFKDDNEEMPKYGQSKTIGP